MTNATSKKLKFSIMRDKSEDEQEEVFAYILAPSCGLKLPDDESYVVFEVDDAIEGSNPWLHKKSKPKPVS